MSTSFAPKPISRNTIVFFVMDKKGNHMMFFSNTNDMPKLCCKNYGFDCDFEVEDDRRTVPFALGTDDGCRVYLNGSLIYDDPSRHGANPWQHFGRLRLRRGWNRVLVKLENGVGNFGLYFQLFDAEVRTARAPE